MNKYCLINIRTGIKTQPLCKQSNKIIINLEEHENQYRINKTTLNLSPNQNKLICNIINKYRYGLYEINFLWEIDIFDDPSNYQNMSIKLHTKKLKDIQLLIEGKLITSLPNVNFDSLKLKEIIDEMNNKKILVLDNVKYFEVDLLKFYFPTDYLKYLNILLIMCERSKNIIINDDTNIIPYQPDNIELLIDILV